MKAAPPRRPGGVAVALARPARQLPREDGWRGVLTRQRLLSRHGKNLSEHFPELLRLVASGCVLGWGELIGVAAYDLPGHLHVTDQGSYVVPGVKVSRMRTARASTES